MKTKLCDVKDVPETGTEKLDFFGREILVYRHSGEPRAVLNYCLHLGGPLALKGGKFVCAWHAAEFSCADGTCSKGPAPKESRLMFLPTRIENDELYYVYND